MLVYGDQRELVEAEQRALEINRRIDALERMPPGFDRHARLVAAFVEMGRFLQGIADAVFAQEQRDRRTEAADDLGATLLRLGRAVCDSWDSDFRDMAPLPRLQAACDWPRQVELRAAEGFAFYAVYPEAYVEAARRLRLIGPARVVGVRSIGTSLSAVVAAALGAAPPVTVRPFGNPSAREIALDPTLERELLEGAAHYVIVDEGPGQSGSSFGAVADWLGQRGVPPERIALVPSHSGAPGPASTGARRMWWRSVQRQVGDFGARWPQLIEDWCSGTIGPFDEAPVDVSGGAWRQLHYAREDDWPATVPAWERRKFVVRANGEPFLVKFAGLGRIGEDQLAVARTLHSEGLVPEPIGIAHGFLIERWCDGSPLGLDDKPLGEIARYLSLRAQLLPASSSSGANAGELLTMARRNISLELGDEFERMLEPWAVRVAELERRVVRVRTDNKLDRKEWLRAKSGAIIKTDSIDHHQSHDLIGCQDLAWDVAAGIVEFDVGQIEADAFIASVEECTNSGIDRSLVEFYRVAYLAFRLGRARLGQAVAEEPRERHRLSRRAERYSAELHHLLESDCRATRRKSSVG